FYQQLADRLRAMPGVRGVAFTSLVPLSGNFDTFGISKIAGEPERAGADAPYADRYVVSPSYFSVMGVRLLRGRLLDVQDRFDAPLVCLVDAVFARRVFGDKDPIGRRMELFEREGEPTGPNAQADHFATIVGVVSNVKTMGLDVESVGQVYTSDVQYPWRWSSLIVHTAGDPLAFTPTVRRVVHDLDAEQPVDDIASLGDYLRDSLRARQFVLALLGAFAAAAIVLAAIGLYGVIAYGVSQRRREFGIRIALGGGRRDIARRVLREGAQLALAGSALGILGALGLGKTMSSILFDISPRDTGTLAIVALMLIAIALAACLVPARRATRVDPAEVLREQ